MGCERVSEGRLGRAERDYRARADGLANAVGARSRPGGLPPRGPSGTLAGRTPARSPHGTSPVADAQPAHRPAPPRAESSAHLVVLDASPNPIVGVDAAGSITDANPQALRAFGYEAAELLGRPIVVLLPEGSAGRHAAHRAAFNGNAMPTARLGSAWTSGPGRARPLPGRAGRAAVGLHGRDPEPGASGCSRGFVSKPASRRELPAALEPDDASAAPAPRKPE